jgi:hypothetical protein
MALTPLARARLRSLEWHLSDWDEDLTYEDILDKLRKDETQGVLVWQPLEDLGGEYLADSIERLTEQFLDMIWWRR